LRLFSFGGYGLAFAVLTLVVFGAYDSYPPPKKNNEKKKQKQKKNNFGAKYLAE